MFTGYLTILVERITVSQPLVAGLRASNSGALAGYGQIPFTMKHCAHWNGPATLPNYHGPHRRPLHLSFDHLA